MNISRIIAITSQAVIILLPACTMEKEIETNQPQKTLVVMAYDRSSSTDRFYQLSPFQIDSMYRQIERKGGGDFASVFIQANSTKQKPITSPIGSCLLIPETGLAVRREKIKRENQNRLQKAKLIRDQFFRVVIPNLLVEQNDQFTDLDGALNMLQLVLKEPRFANYRKVAILITDGRQDLLERGKVPPSAIDLGADEIHLVRPQDDLFLKALGSKQPTTIHATIEEALLSI